MNTNISDAEKFLNGSGVYFTGHTNNTATNARAVMQYSRDGQHWTNITIPLKISGTEPYHRPRVHDYSAFFMLMTILISAWILAALVRGLFRKSPL